VPAAMGIGSYNVKANFVAGGGLYQNANVTYRGVTVGRVESVGLSNDGVVADMRLNSGTPVPENVTATVKSVSAVGEQYIDLVPPEAPSRSTLRNGATIDQAHTRIGQDISGLLTEADKLVSSVGNSRLQDLLRETFKAFNGSGPELARLIQSSRLLVDEANANYGQVTQLIDQAGPFLDAQIRSGDDIKSLAEGLARFTGEVADADPQVRSVLQNVPGAAAAANTTFEGIRPTFPVLAANLANFGRIGVILPQVARAGPGDLPCIDGGADQRRWWCPGRRGRQAGLQGRPAGPAAVFDWVHPADGDQVTGRHHAARTADRPVLQDSTERPRRGARRTQLSVPRIPWQAGTDDSALSRPAGIHPGRQQPVARSTGAVRHTGRGSADDPANEQVPVHPAAG